MVSCIQRGSRLVNQLLSYARGESAEVAMVDLTRMLADMTPLIRSSGGEGVEVRLSAPNEPVVVLVNRDQMEQAVLNLVVNARDALKGRSDPRVDVELTRSESRAQLVVMDNGAGLPADVVDRVFEPFSATKP